MSTILSRQDWVTDSNMLAALRCILSEMWTRRVLFQGRSDPDQLKVIFDSCGTPDQSYLRYDTVLQHKEVINDNQGADSRKVIPVTEIATPPRKRVLRDDSRYHQYVGRHLGLNCTIDLIFLQCHQGIQGFTRQILAA